MKRTILLVLAIIAFIHAAEARQPKRGYRGFLEWSNSVRSDKFGVMDLYGNINMERQGSFYTGFTTSHGYQINTIGKVTPFGDIRLGANVAEGAGIYISPTIGYRFNWGRKMGVNLGAGLSLAGYRAEHYEGIVTGPDSYEIQYVGTKRHIRPYFSFRVGIDF